jgi:hypothetical protein
LRETNKMEFINIIKKVVFNSVYKVINDKHHLKLNIFKGYGIWNQMILNI